MPDPSSDNSQLLIRCPNCSQKFHVPEDILGKTVECGSCEHRFKIHQDVIIRGKKFYPGEKQNPSLDRFRRVPISRSAAEAQHHDLPAGFAPINYATTPDASIYEPATPQRIILGFAGAIFIGFALLLQLSGNSKNGLFYQTSVPVHMIALGFLCLVGIALLLYANPRARGKTATISGLISLFILIPTFSVKKEIAAPVQTASKSQSTAPDNVTGNDPNTNAEPVNDPFATYRSIYYTEPLEKEIQTLAKEKSGNHAYGIWITNLPGENRYSVRDFLIRETESGDTSHLYTRSENFFMVLTDCPHNFQDVAATAARLGRLEKTVPEASVIEIVVNANIFVEPPLNKLNDKSDPAFYDLNLREIQSIDTTRIEKALKRISEVEPKVYRIDFTRQLTALLNTPGLNLDDNICQALIVWAEDPTQSAAIALEHAQKLLAEERPIPPSMINLIVKARNPGVLPILNQLWKNDMTSWEDSCIAFGPGAEQAFLREVVTAQGNQLHSAIRILGEIGGSESIAMLQQIKATSDTESQILIEQAISNIQERQ